MIVKSLLSESTCQLLIYSTSACLPSVFRSFLHVVSSSFNFSDTKVTVPCFNPVSTTFKFVFLSFSFISSELKIVAISISSISSFDKCFLTQPPTNLATIVSVGNPSWSLLKTYCISLFFQIQNPHHRHLLGDLVYIVNTP